MTDTQTPPTEPGAALLKTGRPHRTRRPSAPKTAATGRIRWSAFQTLRKRRTSDDAKEA